MITAAAVVACFWILIVQDTLPTAAERPPEDYHKPYPNIIYKYDAANEKRLALKAGDTCNFDHRKTILPKMTFAEYILVCPPPTKCQFAFDKQGHPIALSTEMTHIEDFDLPGITTSKSVKVAIYYMTCLCPMDHIYSHSAQTCTKATDPPEPDPKLTHAENKAKADEAKFKSAHGIYCSGVGDTGIAAKWQLGILPALAVLALRYSQ